VAQTKKSSKKTTSKKTTKKAVKKKTLVIVESPAKSSTIKKILGANYVVESSVGHIRDLPKTKIGVDVEDNFKPSYSTIKGKGEIAKKLRDLAKKSDKVYLASDPDREGEAIAWHLAQILKLDGEDLNRIEFNEITKTAVKTAIKNPRKIDQDRVDAQQARRILDRLVGYQISPILWKIISSNTSAGRVQSVALKLICDLEDEIKSFVSEKYWEIDGEFNNKINLKLNKIDGEKATRIMEANQAKVEKLEEILKPNKEFEVVEAKVTNRMKNPPNPLKTSTLQQLASSYLGFSASKTMRVAQGLYEGKNIDGTQRGLITYMRTDSVRISEDAKNQAKEFIIDTYGKEYLGGKKESKKKEKIQDAHEAIRPTDVTLTPDYVREFLDSDQNKLYKLIWERFIISQLAPVKYEQFTLLANSEGYLFRGIVNKVVFEGYYKLFKEEDEIKTANFPKIKEGDKLELQKLNVVEGETKPPSRVTESSLVKKLETEGIGRPSTYAAIIKTLKDREYVEMTGKSFVPTELGIEVKDNLQKYFKDIMNVKFTAKMEEELDEIAEGKMNWQSVLKEFYGKFEVDLKKFEEEVDRISNRRIESDVKCNVDGCDGIMLLKTGRFGKFLECENYEECKGRIPLKGIKVPQEDIEKGFIFIKEEVEKAEAIRKGLPTDVFFEEETRMLLKTGRFGEYLESENFEEDKKRIPLVPSLRKIIRDEEVEVKDGIYLLKDLLEEHKTVIQEKKTDVVTKEGTPMMLKHGRFGEYLESENYKEDKERTPLPSEIRKMIRENKIKEEDGVVYLNSELKKIQDEEEKLIKEAGPCEKCGKPFIIKRGRFGKFLACSGFPDCKNMRKVLKKKK